MKPTIISTLVFTWAFVNALAAEYPLVVDGKSDARIQLNPRPSAPEFRAAMELQDYIKKISGAKIPRCCYPAEYYRVNDNPDFIELLIGTLDDTRRLIPESVAAKLAESKSDEAFYIKTDGKRILIIGKKPIGALYGAYTFLEKYLGVRWFHPGADGEFCPSSKTIILGDIDDFQTPSIRGRRVNCWTKSVAPWTMEEVRVWQARNKLRFSSRYQYNDRSRDELDFYECGNEPIGAGGHTTLEAAIPKKIFESHPEYFPLKDDARVCEERSQRCLANPDVQQLVVNHIVNMTSYGVKYALGFHDSTWECWCHCPECVNMGEHDGKFTISNLAHRFMSQVADQVYERNPDAIMRNYIYSEYRDVPTDPNFRYDKRLIGVYCPHQRCYVHRLNDPNAECNAKFFKQLMDWKKLCPRIGIFDYYAYSKSPYCPMEYTLAEDMKLYGEMGLDTWIEDCTNKNLPIPASNWPFYYVAAKMLWDSSLNVDELMDDAYGKYYAAAAEPMKKYQATRRELWESAPGHAAYGGPKRYAYCLTVPGAEKRLVGYLDEADKLAGDDPVLKNRIVSDRNFLNQFWIQEADKLKERMSAQNDVPITKREGEITIDGVLDEADWRKARRVTGFQTKEGSEPVEETIVKVLYDEDNWYFGVEAMTEHAWSPLKADAAKRDDAVWKDDAMEIFLMPPDSDYYHFIINSRGVFYDAKVRSVDFDSQAEIKTRILKDRYVIEARVPAEPMGTKIVDGQTWQTHFYRSCKNLQPPKTTEGSSLDGTPPHEQTLFRRALIGSSAIPNGNFAVIIDKPKKAEGIIGEKFPEGWGGNQAQLIMGENNRNHVELNDLLYTFMRVPRSENPNLINGEVVASGEGEITLWTSTCVRKPDDAPAFAHEIKHDVGSYKLTDKPESLPFAFELAPYENGYLYARVKGDAVIYSVNASRTRK